MKEHPILFSTEMVRAILFGRKTQTRRVANFIPLEPGLNVAASSLSVGDYCTGAPQHGKVLRSKGGACWQDRTNPLRSPYGQPGDRLWVRETLQYGARNNPSPRHNHLWRYAADNSLVMVPEDKHTEMLVWAVHKEGDVCVSIHMPRWASRITLEITDSRIERVQEISEEDAIAEGISNTTLSASYAGIAYKARGRCKREYAALWNLINAKRGYGWDVNPWVWVIEFRRSDNSEVGPGPVTVSQKRG